MSTDVSFRCSQCNKYRLPAEYGTHQRGNRKGDRLSLCLSCSATNTANRKRKRIESNAGHPAKRVAAPHPMSSSDFVAALAEHTSAAQIDDSWRVSVDEMTLPDKDVANHLASLAWNATGYRFSFAKSYTSADGSSTRFTYNCCQARGTANDMAKQSTVGKEKQRVARRMERFDCHGQLHVSLHNGVAVVSITHRQSHKPYVCIDLPEKYRTFIKNHHQMGPAKLWQHILSDSKGDNIVFTQKTVRYAWANVESDPGGFTEPLSLEEDRENMIKTLYQGIELLQNQPSPINPDWYAKYREESEQFLKYVEDNVHDDSSHAPENQ